MSEQDIAVWVSSKAILSDHHSAHQRDADRDKLYAVYANATATPNDADPAVKIVEDVLKKNILAKAQHHSREAERFKAALDKLEAIKP